MHAVRACLHAADAAWSMLRGPCCLQCNAMQLNRFGRGCTSLTKFGSYFEIVSYVPGSHYMYMVRQLWGA